MSSDRRLPRGAVGGAANEAGAEYRRGVAAYFVAHGLNGIPVAGLPLVGAAAVVEAVALETDFPVDDLLVRLSGGSLYAQAKRDLDWRLIPEIADQWIRAVRDPRFDPAMDLLVAVSGSLSGPVGVVARALGRGRAGATSYTRGETDELLRLRGALGDCGASTAEVETVLRCVAILRLEVEDPGQREATAGRLLLDGHVVRKGEGARAWRELLAIAGDTARLRGGYAVASWLQRLRERGVPLTADVAASAAADLTARHEAVARYRAAVVRRGAEVDVTALGIAVLPIPFEEMDADVDFYRPDNDRHGLDPLWAFRRRGRVVLTGLPGGGKSTSLARVAGDWASRAEWAIPVPISLRRLADKASFRRAPLLDQVVDLATELVNPSDRALVGDALHKALAAGGAVLFLDGLDEAADRSLLLVADIAELLTRVHPDTDVLLATRDVAYADTRQLGFVDLRVGTPKRVGRMVTAVLRAIAAVRGVGDVEPWVAARQAWVERALEADRALRQTPLFPVLLASLAADATTSTLPHNRTLILERVIEDVVRRRETARESSLPGVDPAQHAAVLLGCFPLIAVTLLTEGGSAPRARLSGPVAQYLVRDWGLPRAVAADTAGRVLLFWDEAGVFVATGAEKTVAPRLQLLMEVGAALHAAALPDSEARAWTQSVVHRPEAHEALVLAGTKSQAIADALIASACECDDDALVSTAARAVGHGGIASPEALRRLVQALRAGVARGGIEGWRAFRQLAELPVPEDLREDALRAVDAHYPTPYPAIARGVACLDWAWRPECLDEFLETVLVNERPVLPSRNGGRGINLDTLSDDNHMRLLEAAARRLLPSRPDLAPAAVAAMGHASLRVAPVIDDALRASGHGALADAERARWAARDRELLAGVPKLDDMIRDFIGLVRGLAPASSLSLAQQRRMAEFGSFVQTLDLNRMHAWPGGSAGKEIWPQFVDAVATLGGFDRGVLAAQADILQRERVFGYSGAGDALLSLLDLHPPVPLMHWGQGPDVAVTRDLLLSVLRTCGDAARMVAAGALHHHPDREGTAVMVRAVIDSGPAGAAYAAVWAYLHIMDDLNAAVALASSDRACVREAVARMLRPVHEGRVTALARALADDPVRQVRLAVLEHFEGGDDDVEPARSLLEHVAASADPAFTCHRCGTGNPAEADSCSSCHIVVRRPSEIARRVLGDPLPADPL